MNQLDQDNEEMIVSLFLHSKNFRQYNIPMAKSLGGIEYAVLLTDLIDQFHYFKEKGELVSHIQYGDGFMYYTIDKAYERCAMGRYSFESGIKIFIEKGFIKDVVKFGDPYRKYFRLCFKTLKAWMLSNNSYSLQKPANKLAETSKLVCRNQQTLICKEPNNEPKKEPKNRLSNPVRRKDNIIHPDKTLKESPSFSTQGIAFFDPLTYKLKDGNYLSRVMAKTLAKKMKDPLEASKIKENILWYENSIDQGVIPRRGHEIFLQNAINHNLASKNNKNINNSIYARLTKEENKLSGLRILKTVVQLDKKDGSKPESVSLELPEETFSSIIDRYSNQQRDK